MIFYEIYEIGFRDGPGEPAQALRQNVRAVRLRLRGPAVGFARLAGLLGSLLASSPPCLAWRGSRAGRQLSLAGSLSWSGGILGLPAAAGWQAV